MTHRINRRRFLTAMGLTSGGLLLPSLSPNAGAGDGPKRLVIFFSQHGTWYDGWKMRRPGLAEDARWSFDLNAATEAEMSAALRPLHRHRNRTTVVDGLALVSGEADRAGGFRHEIGEMHAITGANMELTAGKLLAGGPSIDQRIADVIARDDRHRSIEMAVGGPPVSVNFRGEQLPLPMENNPRVMFDRLFGLIDSATGDNPVLTQQGSVLDKVHGRYAHLAKQLSTEDQRRLDTHRDLVREVEQRVTGLLDATCGGTPTPPDVGGEADIPRSFDAFVQLTTAAFACDLVRVATIQVGTLSGDLVGLPGANIHDNYAHQIYSPNPDTAQAAQQVMTDYTAYHASQVSQLADALDAVGLLDDTMILWVGELADGWHGFEKWPAVIVGGDGFQGGTYHHYPSDVPYAGWSASGALNGMGQPHQKLLISVAQKLGVSIDALPVKEVYGIDGARIDCTGPLEGLV